MDHLPTTLAEAWQAFENDLTIRHITPEMRLAIRTTFITGATAAYYILVRNDELGHSALKTEIDAAQRQIDVEKKALKGGIHASRVQ